MPGLSVNLCLGLLGLPCLLIPFLTDDAVQHHENFKLHDVNSSNVQWR